MLGLDPEAFCHHLLLNIALVFFLGMFAAYAISVWRK